MIKLSPVSMAEQIIQLAISADAPVRMPYENGVRYFLLGLTRIRQPATERAMPSSINLSASDIRQKEFPENLVSFTENHGIDPARLEIEITETMFMSDIQACTQKLQVVSNRGISIAIDDFGTGYSSLNYLRELPVHTVKIDYSFVSEIEHSRKGAALVAAIVGMAHGLGIDIIAEGVENSNQSDYLESLGCHTMQGFLFSKPLKVEEFLDLIAAQQAAASSLSSG